jgi:hypothetical protein
MNVRMIAMLNWSLIRLKEAECWDSITSVLMQERLRKGSLP